MRWLHLLRL